MSYVLLVEDNREHLDYLSTLLTHHHLAHACVPHGAAALAKAREAAPSLVLSDLQMPLMDGYTLLRHWKSDAGLRHIPFVVHTSTYIEMADEDLAVELGADDFILKFEEPEELIARLNRIMARSQQVPAVPRMQPNGVTDSTLEQYNRILFRKLDIKTEALRAAKKRLDLAASTQRDAAATHRSILNGLPIQVAVIDKSGLILEMNEAWRRDADSAVFPSPHAGVSASYLEILDALAADNPDCRELAAGIRTVLSGEAATFSTEHARRSSAASAWMETTVVPLQGVGSGGAVIMATDITERKYIAAKIVESEAQYLLLLNSAAEGIYRIDTKGVCVFCNATAARLLGYDDPNEVIGHALHDLHHHTRADGTSYPASECKALRALSTETSIYVDDERYFRRDGSHFPVEYRSDPIWDGDRVTGAVVIFMDITERLNLQMQLLQSQKMEAVGQLAGGVAHDFNNALQVILTHSELLAENLPHDLVSFEHNQQILEATRRAASVTRQLLTFSRKQLINPILLDLSKVMRHMEDLIRRMIGERISLELAASPDVMPILADRSQLEQIIMNLVINARDAMPLSGEMFIAVSNINVSALKTQEHKLVTPGMYVMLKVRDTGIGMTRETRQRIFEPFFTTKEAGKGTGLGLSIVHGIVEQSAGYITVSSEPGGGTEFCVYFKAVGRTSDVPPLTQQGAPPSKASNGSGTILLVEDEGALRAIVGQTLREQGYAVLEARDGATAIDVAKNHDGRIDALLIDVILPVMSGREVADQLILLRPAMRIIYMSGYTDDIIAQHGILNPSVVLLEKPFSKESLLDTVQQALMSASAPQP